MAKIDFGGIVEEVVTRDEFPLKKAKEVLKNEMIAVIGYGVQGPAQSLNMRDNGFKVIIGQAPEFKREWDKAVKDGWVPGKTLFPIEEAAKKATIIQYLVSDAAQKAVWPKLKACLKEGDALYFSHGFSIVYKEQTGVIPPAERRRDPGGAQGLGGQRARQLPGRERHQLQLRRVPGRHRAGQERTLAVGIAIGSGLPLPDHLRARGLQRPHRRARRADGRAGRASWRPSTTCCARTATPPARPSTRPSRSSPRA